MFRLGRSFAQLRLLKKEFRNPLGTDKKQNMFHNPFFVDLAEGLRAQVVQGQEASSIQNLLPWKVCS